MPAELRYHIYSFIDTSDLLRHVMIVDVHGKRSARSLLELDMHRLVYMSVHNQTHKYQFSFYPSIPSISDGEMNVVLFLPMLNSLKLQDEHHER